MKCKKCKKSIPDGSKFCNFCGTPQDKKKLYRRPDGLYEKSVIIEGKRKVFRAKSEKEIEKKMIAYKEEIATGPLLETVVDEWEEHHFKDLQLSTQKSYKPCMVALKDYFHGEKIRTINAAALQSFFNSQPLSFTKKTLRNYRSIVSSIFSFAVRMSYIDSSPVLYTKIEQGKKSKRRQALTDEEIAIITNSLDKPFGLFAYLLLFTGCRRAEALALTYEDIDFKNHIIHINKSVSWEHCKPYLKEPKTEAGTREVILFDILADKLSRGTKGIIFQGKNGLMTEKEYRCRWETYQKATGLTITAHNIRHGYATLLHEAGIDAKEAQGQLGHADISTTLDVYTNTTKKSRKNTADKMNNYINTQILHSSTENARI
jgi:integrase